MKLFFPKLFKEAKGGEKILLIASTIGLIVGILFLLWYFRNPLVSAVYPSKSKTHDAKTFKANKVKIVQYGDKIKGAKDKDSKVVLHIFPDKVRHELKVDEEGEWRFKIREDLKENQKYLLVVQYFDQQNVLERVRSYKIKVVSNRKLYKQTKEFTKWFKKKQKQLTELFNLGGFSSKTYSVVTFDNKHRYKVRPSDTLVGNAIPNSKVEISLTPGNSISNANVNQKGEWSYQIPKNIPEGKYTITIVNYDKRQEKAYRKIYKIKISSPALFGTQPAFAFEASVYDPEYRAWARMMRSFDIFPNIEDEEIILYSRDEYLDRFCQPKGCVFEDFSNQEVVASANENIDLIFDLRAKLHAKCYDGVNALAEYFPEATNINWIPRVLGFPGYCAQQGISASIEEENLANIIKEVQRENGFIEAEARENFKDPLQALITVSDPIFSTRLLVDWATSGNNKAVSYNDNYKMLLGFTMIYGIGQLGYLGAEAITPKTFVNVGRMNKYVGELGIEIKNNPVSLEFFATNFTDDAIVILANIAERLSPFNTRDASVPITRPSVKISSILGNFIPGSQLEVSVVISENGTFVDSTNFTAVWSIQSMQNKNLSLNPFFVSQIHAQESGENLQSTSQVQVLPGGKNCGETCQITLPTSLASGNYNLVVFLTKAGANEILASDSYAITISTSQAPAGEELSPIEELSVEEKQSILDEDEEDDVGDIPVPECANPDSTIPCETQVGGSEPSLQETGACEDVYYSDPNINEETNPTGCIHKYSPDSYPNCNYLFDPVYEPEKSERCVE